MKVHSFGYVGINATDLPAWREFASNVLGVQVRDDSDGDTLLLKIDDYKWRIAIHQSDVDGFAYGGFELNSRHAFDAAVEELKGAGVEVELATDDPAKTRGVGGLAVIHDPAGNRIELYCRPTVDYNFTSPKGSTFVAGDQGFGHAVFIVTADKYEECQDFYTRVLGFKVSEYTSLGPIEVCFLHTNRRHHSVALARGPINWCQHIMLQVTELDMVGMAHDRATAAGVTITSSLGRHRNDNMFSFYMRTPSMIDVEVGWGAREITDEETWTVNDWEGGDVWGHHGLADMLPGA
jgi:3,4-dihydroxy-9,10-secoandrosta-1,3,5(10)-triene-9,17-dione 4,5-dioxygenase